MELIRCGCCHEDFDNEIDNINVQTLSCGHKYHYECIYDAFLFNKKRGACILECPYCRKKITPIHIKENIDYNEYIHIETPSEILWLDFKLGSNHCCYQNANNKYCNALHHTNTGVMLCSKHRNKIHKGIGYCCLKMTTNNWCNIKVVDTKNAQYCWHHEKYDTYYNCCHIFKSGRTKGTKCGALSMEPYCEKHLKQLNKKTADLTSLINLTSSSSSSEAIILNTIQVCVYIYRRGESKGQQCGLLNCQKHGIKKQNTVI